MIQSWTISHEEHKTLFSGLVFSGMALSYQSEFPTFFPPRPQSIQKSAKEFFPTQRFRKMTCPDWPNPRSRLIENSQIPKDDLPRTVKSPKMTYQDWPKPDLRQAGISQAPEHQLPVNFQSQKRIWWNQQPKAIFLVLHRSSNGRTIPLSLSI